MDQVIPMLIVGMVISLGVGFIVGERVGSSQQLILPSNWDPSAAALKLSDDNLKTCYAILIDHVSTLKSELSKLDTCKHPQGE